MENKIIFILCFLPLIYLWVVLRIFKTKKLPKLSGLLRDLWNSGINV